MHLLLTKTPAPNLCGVFGLLKRALRVRDRLKNPGFGYAGIAFPFANVILTLIGVAISSRKVRGGIGMHLGIGITLTFGIGITLTFTYILFMQISSVFSTYGGLNPTIAVWIPNLVFAAISFYLIKTAPK